MTHSGTYDVMPFNFINKSESSFIGFPYIANCSMISVLKTSLMMKIRTSDVFPKTQSLMMQSYKKINYFDFKNCSFQESLCGVM